MITLIKSCNFKKIKINRWISMHINHDENYVLVSYVISSLWHDVRTCKVCVTRRPWMGTPASCLTLYIWSVLSMFYAYMCLHWLLCLHQKDDLDSCDIKNLLQATYLYIFFHYNKYRNKTFHLNVFITAAPDFYKDFPGVTFFLGLWRGLLNVWLNWTTMLRKTI